jgi:type VI secretion system protein ImpE
MNPSELLKAADTAATLKALSENVRAKPADAKLRVFLAQLLCVMGQWERALNQLTVAAELDALAVPMKQMYGDAIRCEGLRADVFSGKRTPMVFGQPDEWLALLIESLLRNGRGESDAAQELRTRAFDAAPASKGHLDGVEFDWLADADMRLGPVLEAYVNGRYYWVPFARLAKVTIEPPEDLRDCVWLPAHLQFENGGESLALIPTRYEGSHLSSDGQIQLARKTEWQEPYKDVWVGQGQRVLTSDKGEHAIMDVREISFEQASV